MGQLHVAAQGQFLTAGDSAIKVLHQGRELLLREGPECRILPGGSFLKELPQRLYVIEHLHIEIGPGELRITEHF